jgi:flagellin
MPVPLDELRISA